MDVSQLCSASSDETTPFPTSLKNESDQTPTKSRRTPASLDFILSPYEEPKPEQQQRQGDIDPPTSNEMVFDQCSKLCESIWQLKLQHKTMSTEDRESMIDSLSKSAQDLFKTIQSSDQWMSKDNAKKRESNTTSNTNYDEEDNDDDDDEEEDDDEERASTEAPVKDHAEYELIRQARNLQDAQSRPKYRRRNRRSMIGQKCHSCSTTETPEWRRGPDGARTLCNACGLHYSKLLRKGSIVVQTNNYLVTGGIPPRSPSIVSATAISNNSKNTNPAPSLVNFPFVLMDPNHDKKQFPQLKSSIPYTQPNIVNNSINNPPLPSQNSQQQPSQQDTNSSRNSSGNQNSITPLRIHQWKQH